MHRRLAAFSLIDLLAASAVTVVLLAAAVPMAARARELGKRSLCGANLAGIGAAAKVYATANNESWPVPPFKNSSIDTHGIEYLLSTNGLGGTGQTGHSRRHQSNSDFYSPHIGSTQVAVTRAYWMLVRFGDVTVRQFICPSSDDVPDPTADVDLYYDFFDIGHISYGYQVPFGPTDTRPREGMDHRQVVAADKGPWYLVTPKPNWNVGPQGRAIRENDQPHLWRPFNSPNHGGPGNGEGQNVLFADGSVSFVRIPAVGVDNDNFYTLMTDRWLSRAPFNRIHGETPHERSPAPYPGQGAFGFGAGKHASTDSLIYP